MPSTPSPSPPRTPDDRRHPTSTTTPSSDDSSIIDDLSFDYIQDSDGNLVRLSKGSSSKSNYSSPPTPQDSLQPDIPAICEPHSPDLLQVSPMARATLSRSEGAFPAQTGSLSAVQNDKPARSFQRVASGPLLTQAPSFLPSTSNPSLSKPRVAPRRVTMEDARETLDSVGASRSRQTLDANAYSHALQEEKENISESDEIPIIQTATIVKKHRNSPPLVTRSTSATSTRTPSNRTPYGSGSSSAGSRPLADVSLAQRTAHARQIVSTSNRATRIVKSSSLSKYSTPSNPSNFDRISEVESSDNELAPQYFPIHTPGEDDTEPEDDLVPSAESVAYAQQPVSSNPLLRSRSAANSLSQSGNSRPRRSASLSNALKQDDYHIELDHQYRERSGTSSALTSDAGARRVPSQGDKKDLDLKKYRHQDGYQESRQSPSPSPSPTNNDLQSSRTPYNHKRRDSDTLRNAPSSAGISSPTVVGPDRNSTPGSRLQLRYSPPGVTKSRLSPPSLKGHDTPTATAATVKGRTSPPGAKGRLSPAIAGNLVREISKHRRSPTAPEPPTRSAVKRDRVQVGEEYEPVSSAEREKERERERKWLQIQQQQKEQEQQYLAALPPPPLSAPAVPQASGPAPPPPSQFNRHILVNKKAYARLDVIGRGGSSRVFRVLSHANELYAIKRVTLDKTDTETLKGYMNEIALLKRLEGNSRIIRLIDSEVKPGPGGSKGHLLLVMEVGEIDFSSLLQDQMKEPLNMVWVAYYWQQMLQAVHVIHEEKIVHSDLKPANFVLVRGQLKLIDFGIANAIANDTTNIQRDHTIGTMNYISPEAIELQDGMRRLKVGRPSDVWSLGCILYQMIYGQPPFYHLTVFQKMKAIPDLTYVIEFPEYATPLIPPAKSPSGDATAKKLDHLKQRVGKDVIMSMKSCLCRNSKERATIPDLFDHSWLSTSEPNSQPAKNLLKENEAIINPYYMQQLLEYSIKLAGEGGLDAQSLLKDAERLVQELKAIQH